MLVGNFFKNINPKNKSHYFSGLSFNSLDVKKIIFFLELKEQKIMVTNLLKMQLKMEQEQLFLA